jgi:hypothetical protein
MYKLKENTRYGDFEGPSSVYPSLEIVTHLHEPEIRGIIHEAVKGYHIGKAEITTGTKNPSGVYDVTIRAQTNVLPYILIRGGQKAYQYEDAR